MSNDFSVVKRKTRDELTIVEDRAKIATLLAQGYRSRTEIASIINRERSIDVPELKPEHVTADIDYMKKKYAEQGIEDYNVYRHETLNEINLLMKTAWESYQLSRRNKITIESDAILDDDQYDEAVQTGIGLSENEKVFQRMAKIKEEQRLDGNPAFLQIIANCTDRKAKIYGIDAPNKLALTDATGQKDASNILDFMHQQIEELAIKHEQKQLAASSSNKETESYVDAELIPNED